MTELKTLKDLEFELVGMKQILKKAYYQKSLFGSSRFIDPKELKAEAMKWVKFYCGNSKELTLPQAVLKSTFETFFNLTEKDLK